MIDVVLRADQPVLLGTPEGEAHTVDGLDLELRHLQRGLEDRRRAGAVVVDAGALVDGVEVGADDDRAVLAAGRGVGDDVRGRRRDGLGVHGDAHGHGLTVREPVVELLTHGERRPDHRDVHLRRVERARDDAEAVVVRVLVALVEDHDGKGPCGVGVGRLLPERARASLHECDRPGREAGEVGRGAAALRPTRRRDRDSARGNERSREVTGARVVHRRVFAVETLDVGLRVGRHALERARVEDELVVREVLDRDLIARLGQEVGDVVHGCRVPGRAGSASAPVRVGDGLERLLVLHDPGDRHRVPQGGRVGPDCGRAERRQDQRHCSCCKQQEFPRQEMPPLVSVDSALGSSLTAEADPLSPTTVANRGPTMIVRPFAARLPSARNDEGPARAGPSRSAHL
jgi:hypothetical protein